MIHLILSFFKNKEVWNLSSCLILPITFAERYFPCYILSINQISLSPCLYFVRNRAVCVLHLFVNQGVMSWILKLTSSFNPAVFPTWPKKRVQNLNILRTKSFWDVIKSIFHHFKGLSIKQITFSFFLKGENPTLSNFHSWRTTLKSENSQNNI